MKKYRVTVNGTAYEIELEELTGDAPAPAAAATAPAPAAAAPAGGEQVTSPMPGTILRGRTVVGENCQIGPQVMLTDCVVGDGCAINASQCEDSTIERGCEIGPYTHIRPHCVVGEGSKLGAFVQVKNCKLGAGTKMAHLTYVGDTDVGDNCNFGCGTVTCNYDGFQKFRSTIGDDVFVGCNTNLVPPVTVGEGAYTAAGTTIDEDVPAGALAIGRVHQQIKEGWSDEKIAFKKDAKK